ncbi:formylglycine-generating enzyme family protein [Microcella sp.]|uniref:formylglycine-generating enzyme family protein n=1 Tax=Microcella sp. TaxID=1913979 RepID=UPI003F70EB9F
MTDAVVNLDLVTIEPGEFAMGSTEFYPEEAPVRRRLVDRFRIARAPVTNAQFGAFVDATGYVTTAERPLPEDDFPGLDDAARLPGSLVFTMTAGPVDLSDWRQWWSWEPGACWRTPFGPGSDIRDKGDHPVVQVSLDDAEAYCAWAGGRLPTEVEWEFAARGGIDGAVFAWGDEPQRADDLRANTWQGSFPWSNTGARGWHGTSPVGTFPPNGYGLVDVVGNVWEWTATPWTDRHSPACECSPQADLAQTGDATSSGWVAKGGSHLCAPEYCLRYRPAARTRQSRDSSTTHMGFRVARDA